MEKADLKRLMDVVKLCKKMGVLELKINGLEIKLAQSATEPKSKIKFKDDKPIETNQLSDEELLFWSAPNQAVT